MRYVIQSGATNGLSLRRVAAVVLIVVTALLAGPPAKANYASLLMDANTGRVLYEANADIPRYPASLTKMMTLYMLFEALDEGRLTLGQPLYTSSHASVQSPTKLGLHPGQSISVEDAILALVTKSANDAAAVIAEALGGSEEHFAWQMTAKAHQLGMNQTNFANASGLPDQNQVTTARDMAILALALLHDFPHYYQYFGTERFYWGGAFHPNHNRLLGAYPGVDGIKTGYTHASGFNLVASAQRDGRRLIGVVMGARSPGSRSAIMTSLLDQAFFGGQIYMAQDDEPQTPAAGSASTWGAVAPVAVAAAAQPPLTQVARAESVPSRKAVRARSNRTEARTSRTARSTKVAARSATSNRGTTKQVAARAKATPAMATSRASAKSRANVQLASTQRIPKRPVAVVRSEPAAKPKPATAVAQSKSAGVKPAKATKTAVSTPKRRVADNERGSRS